MATWPDLLNNKEMQVLRVLSVHDEYEDVDKVFNEEIDFPDLASLEAGVNKYLPDFAVSPNLKKFKFKARSFLINSHFGNYEFIDVETGEVTEQRLVQITLALEIDEPDYLMGDKDYNLRIDVVCNDPQQISEIEKSAYIPQTSASQAMAQMVITKKYSPTCKPLFI